MSSLRIIVSAGEHLRPNLFERFRSRTHFEILNGLGMTEMLQTCISNRPGSARAGSCGQVVPGYEAAVMGMITLSRRMEWSVRSGFVVLPRSLNTGIDRISLRWSRKEMDGLQPAIAFIATKTVTSFTMEEPMNRLKSGVCGYPQSISNPQFFLCPE